MRFVTAAQMKQLDELAIYTYGIPSIILMENAGIACANEVVKRTKSKRAKIAIFCGIGNNGGDGFAAARHLHNRGYQPTVFFFQKPEKMKLDPQTNFNILKKMQVPLVYCSEDTQWENLAKTLKSFRLIVDAIFGTGLTRPVLEPFRSAIHVMNHSRLDIIAVDVPSGLNSDTGEVMGVCVRAKATVTLGLPKKGFSLKKAHRYTRRVVVADISIPTEVIHQFYDFDVKD
ncbi:MAG: NAD(P)H-hydrate epimerase [Candidatus Omnitrophica bacterium CG11_big_fil_rev_8_21_14_0_20_45_26]|uniref:NAD(P)H-hydrate epimerase n=1 Tax=Candidatus Abzuiibacterium crystallinum TaxID=1974748 RepID=A0A2H0LP59_9BACT|nr:MAG: NAD(P)H-hydrate epimerase [Candidatus Omnitrophica bacterium CG11_big_fil_rev_8_21_14_0_20_45_26]PIW64107.1 MAG: NAD(P)H-hydrate epimerase [Candidatus Omnitrophica bacterium CG12_big_fil_rev_8_21_14_0_65_45_16]